MSDTREIPIGSKYCPGCDTVKVKSDFHKNNRRKDGVCWVCKSCSADYRKDQYKKHRQSEINGVYKWRTNQVEYLRQYERKRTLRRYGLTLESYEVLLSSQAGRCAICGTPSTIRNLSVDHDHRCCPDHKKSCGRCVRGLLCDRCNQVIGLLDDNPELAVSVASYLEKHR